MNVELLASKLNNIMKKLVSRSNKDPLAKVENALGGSVGSVNPDICIFSSKTAYRIKMVGILVILIAPDWPIWMWYSDLIRLQVDALLL